MGFADVWNRTLVYFGIAEEDDWEDEPYEADDQLERAYAERPNVRRLRGRPVQAPDRLRQRPHVCPGRRHAARRGQGLPPDAAQRRGLRRGARASPRARFLQPGLIRPVRVMPGRPVPTMILEWSALPL